MKFNQSVPLKVTVTKTGINGWYLEFVTVKTAASSYKFFVNKKLDGSLLSPEDAVISKCKGKSTQLLFHFFNQSAFSYAGFEEIND